MKYIYSKLEKVKSSWRNAQHPAFYCYTLWVSRVLKYPLKVFEGFDNVFHVYLMRGFQISIWKKLNSHDGFCATCKIAQPNQPIWQQILALPKSALKKPPWEFNFFHIFRIPTSSRHEKCGQIFQTLFWYFNTLETDSVQKSLWG